MKPAVYDLRFYRGDTVSIVFRLLGDRTGHIPRMQIRDGPDGTILANLTSSLTATLEPSVGIEPVRTAYRFRSLTPLEVEAIRGAGSATYDFEVTSGVGAGAVVSTYLRGRVRIDRDITKVAP